MRTLTWICQEFLNLEDNYDNLQNAHFFARAKLFYLTDSTIYKFFIVVSVKIKFNLAVQHFAAKYRIEADASNCCICQIQQFYIKLSWWTLIVWNFLYGKYDIFANERWKENLQNYYTYSMINFIIYWLKK